MAATKAMDNSQASRSSAPAAIRRVSFHSNDFYEHFGLRPYDVESVRKVHETKLFNLFVWKQRGLKLHRDVEGVKWIDPPRPPHLPPRCESKQLTLVLDLDETLVSSLSRTPTKRFDIVKTELRPFAKEFLEQVSKVFEVIIFTAGQKWYADKILDQLDPEGKHIFARLYRDSCSILDESNYIKDLSLLGRPLDTVVLLDNSPISAWRQPRNLIPVKSWYLKDPDLELLRILPLLGELVLTHRGGGGIYGLLDEHAAHWDLCYNREVQAYCILHRLTKRQVVGTPQMYSMYLQQQADEKLRPYNILMSQLGVFESPCASLLFQLFGRSMLSLQP